MKGFWPNGLRLYTSARIIVCALSDTFRLNVCCLKRLPGRFELQMMSFKLERSFWNALYIIRCV